MKTRAAASFFAHDVLRREACGLYPRPEGRGFTPSRIMKETFMEIDMRKDLDELLVKNYAPLYRNRHGDMRTTAMCWGFEVGDGWFGIIDALSASLCSSWLQAKYEYENLAGKVGQPLYKGGEIVSPEKVGAAKAVMEREEKKIPVAMQVKEKFGTLRFYVSGGEIPDADVSIRTDALIEMAERLSATTCEECGSPGRLTRGGWISCKCDACRAKASMPLIADEYPPDEKEGGF